jgi:hypothetical protein
LRSAIGDLEAVADGAAVLLREPLATRRRRRWLFGSGGDATLSR